LHACNHGNLSDGQFIDRLAKVSAGRCIDTVRPCTEIGLVKVHPQDLILCIHLLKPGRDDRFFDLTFYALLGFQEDHFSELLRDGASSLDNALCHDVLIQGAQYA